MKILYKDYTRWSVVGWFYLILSIYALCSFDFPLVGAEERIFLVHLMTSLYMLHGFYFYPKKQLNEDGIEIGHNLVLYSELKGIYKGVHSIVLTTNDDDKISFDKLYIENYKEVKSYLEENLNLDSISFFRSFSSFQIAFNLVYAVFVVYCIL